jgi:hypothetical protein
MRAWVPRAGRAIPMPLRAAGAGKSHAGTAGRVRGGCNACREACVAWLIGGVSNDVAGMIIPQSGFFQVSIFRGV